jgi:anion-transporting  ArsA/GET3 family ATPase
LKGHSFSRKGQGKDRRYGSEDREEVQGVREEQAAHGERLEEPPVDSRRVYQRTGMGGMQAPGGEEMRSLLVAVLLLSAGCAKRVTVDTPPEITTERLLTFNEAYLKFFKAYYGCP